MTIRFKDVSKSFGTKQVLNEISFTVERGEILFILGKSGMGKSVTLKTIIGLLRPDSGQVWVEDRDVAALSADALAEVRRYCGMVFQHPALLDSLSVFENVAFGLRTTQFITAQPKPWSESQIRQRVIETLSLVNLGEDILEKMPPQISYGMQKRVSLARTLAPGPQYLLFDEPTTGLDPITTQAVNLLIRDLSRRLKVTSIVVSHDMRCALAIADRVLVLDQARILALDTPEKLQASQIPLIQDFLSEAMELEPVKT